MIPLQLKQKKNREFAILSFKANFKGVVYHSLCALLNSETYVCCRITVQFYSGTWKTGGTVNFNEEQNNWQFGSGSAAASVNYNKIRVVVEYKCQMNTAWFGGLYLYPEQFGTEYGYDGRGNRITARSLWGKSENSTYDDYGNTV